MAYFLDYDPPAILRQLKTPVLILMGGTDQQVTPDQAPKLVRAFVEAGNRDVTARVFGNLNHLFIYDPNGFPMGYATLPRRKVEPEVIGAIADWLVERLRP
jgi:dipeptidyl aminopeptidase/acylaminoacyl peptidase